VLPSVHHPRDAARDSSPQICEKLVGGYRGSGIKVVPDSTLVIICTFCGGT
jgi:hypothetical protein